MKKSTNIKFYFAFFLLAFSLKGMAGITLKSDENYLKRSFVTYATDSTKRVYHSDAMVLTEVNISGDGYTTDFSLEAYGSAILVTPVSVDASNRYYVELEPLVVGGGYVWYVRFINPPPAGTNNIRFIVYSKWSNADYIRGL